MNSWHVFSNVQRARTVHYTFGAFFGVVADGSFASQRSGHDWFQPQLIPCLRNPGFSGLLLISVDFSSHTPLCSHADVHIRLSIILFSSFD